MKEHKHIWVVERKSGVLGKDIWMCKVDGCMAKPRGKDYDHKLWWFTQNQEKMKVKEKGEGIKCLLDGKEVVIELSNSQKKVLQILKQKIKKVKIGSS